MAQKKSVAKRSATSKPAPKKTSGNPTRKPGRNSTTSPDQAPSQGTSPKAEAVKASVAYANLPGVANEPTGPAESWRQSMAARTAAFENTSPAYMLDDNFFFLDWNPAFDELFAKPLNLKRRTNHAGDFVAELVNPNAILKRAAKVFDTEPRPLVDVEPLQLQSKKYGRIDFRKIALQVTDTDARLTAWTVYLNIESCEKLDLLWGDLQRRLEFEQHWSRYAVSYDKLLLNFPEYAKLLDDVIAGVCGTQRCLDIGAGTGNATLRLLKSDNSVEISAVEPNHAMVQQLISKVDQLEKTTHLNYFSRLQVLKESVLDLDRFPRLLRPGSYDAALLVNVLYAVDDPQKCLQKVAALLRRGGRISISTPHRDTNVDRLFDAMKDSLKGQGLFNSLRSNFDDARQRHMEMMSSIHRDTKADIRSYVQDAGFRITDWKDAAYAGAVVIVQAEKI